MMDWEKDMDGFFQEFRDRFVIDQRIFELEFENFHLFFREF